MRVYHARRSPNGCQVTVDGAPLKPRSDLSGAIAAFDWGYTGNVQLSIALLSDLLDDPQQAMALCERFDREVVARLPRDGWTITEGQFARAVAQLKGPPMSEPAHSNAPPPPNDRDGKVAFGDMPVQTAGLVPPSLPGADAPAARPARIGTESDGHVAFGDMPIIDPNGR